MTWYQIGEYTYRFEPWARQGWDLTLTFYEDVDEVLGRLWLSSPDCEPFFQLRTFGSPEEFSAALTSLIADAARTKPSTPNQLVARDMPSSDWLNDTYRRAKQHYNNRHCYLGDHSSREQVIHLERASASRAD